jgi:hypothetical protein
MIKTLIHSILIAGVSACLVFSFIESAQSADKSPVRSNFSILGLFIGECSSRDVYSKLGPGITFKDAFNADVTQACYVSSKDETLILFSFESSRCSGLRLLSQKKKFYKWHFCETSPLVSKHLATGSGIKLGISKSRLQMILGTPQGESEDALLYVYEWKFESGTAETQGDSQGSGNPGAAPARTVKATVRAEFSDAKLISFDVSKTMQ